jgi:peptidoglycan/xylan/chitin deacetylase (PgdA/CDA1 family)
MPQPAFVNEAKLFVPGEVDARIALLQQWVEAGVILGDHTYSHAEFNQLTVEQFEDEIVKGDVITRRLMQSRQPYQLYFRHPETHTGDNQAKKEAINADCLNDLLQRLEARGYRFVTLDEAMSDPAYRTRDTLVTKSGPTWLWRWMKSKGMAIGFRGDPDPPEWPEVKK